MSNLLCIGGPLDGKYITSNGSGLVVPISEYERSTPRTLAELEPAGEPVSNSLPIGKTVEYVKSNWTTPDGRIQLWKPKDQSDLQTMERLLSAYAGDLSVIRATGDDGQAYVKVSQRITVTLSDDGENAAALMSAADMAAILKHLTNHARETLKSATEWALNSLFKGKT